MDTALMVARCLLAGVFAVAGLAKLADLPGSRAALTGFEVPARFVPAGAVALPLTELLAAVLLVIAPTAQVGGVIATLLLAAFIVGIERAVRRGRAPECHCFGQISSKPASRETSLRNAVLAAPAIFVAIGGPGPGFISWADDEGATATALVITSVATGLLALAYYLLWQEKRRLLGHGAAVPDFEPPLPVGQLLPDFAVQDFAGGKLDKGGLIAGERGILVFVSATCGPCHALLPDMARWKELLDGRLGVHVLSTGEREANLALAEEHALTMYLDGDAKASRACRVLATPSAIEYDAEGRVASEAVAGGVAIEALIRTALKRPAPEPFALDVRDAAGRS